MTVEEFRGEGENFPLGMRVLAVDDDRICLKLLETLLRKCQYHVTTTSQARVALNMLRDNKDRFDLVISDVHMPDMDGFKLLELVGLEMDLPVIMLSANSDPKLVMKGVSHGACDYLVKPVRIEELKNIWQHVFRRKKLDKNQSNYSDQANAHQASEGLGSPLTGNTDQSGKFSRKRKDEEDESEDNENESEDPGAQKKPRVVWSIDLHRKFVGAVNQLGIEKAVPKRILDLMNVDGLTRENVASHLQKYRLYLKRISTVTTQQANMAAALGVKDSPFMHMGSLEGLGDYRSLSGARLANVALSPYTSGGMLGRLNSPTNVNLRNLTPSTLVQPSQAQNVNSISSLGKMNLVLPSSNQNSGLLQGIPSSLHLDQLQANKGPTSAASFNTVENSRMFRTGIGSSNNLFNSIRSNSVSVGGYINQSAHEMACFTAESFNPSVSGSSNLLDPGKCNNNWQNTVESSRMHPNALLSTEPLHSQLPLNGLRDDNSPNGPFVQNNPTGLSSGMAFEDSREMQSQSWANGIMSNLGQNLDQNNGLLKQKMDMIITGRSNGSGPTFLQQQEQQQNENENEKSTTECRRRPNEDFLLEQSKMQGGFGPQGFDSLDELVNAMIKREENIPNCDFGIEDYCFGAAAM